MPLQERIEMLRAYSMAVFRFTDHPFQAFDRKHGRHVTDGSSEGGHRNPFSRRDLVRLELRPVSTNRGRRSGRARSGDLNLAALARSLDPPKRSRGTVAQNCSFTRRQNCGEPATSWWDNPVTNRVHAGMQPMQPTAANSPLDCAFGHPQAKQLRPRHDPVLPVGQVRNPPIERPRLRFPSVCDCRCTFA